MAIGFADLALVHEKDASQAKAIADEHANAVSLAKRLSGAREDLQTEKLPEGGTT
jgi:hypothetical protein